MGVFILIAALDACGGGGGAGGGSNVTPASSTTLVTGTLQIAFQPRTSASASMRQAGSTSIRRRPQQVSTGTRHAALFIDHSATPAGSTTTCTATNGTGTGCTISWTANLSVPASHVFSVETDTGTTVIPNNTVLDVGQGTYTVFPGINNLGTGGNGNPLSLNSVAHTYFYNITGCSGATCNGTISWADAAAFTAFYAGALTTPTEGNNPTSGNVFDNDGGGTPGVSPTTPITLTSDNAAIGTITGTAQAPFTTYASGTLTFLGFNATQTWTWAGTCAAAANGKFGIQNGGGTTPSGDVTTAELTGIGVTYPAGTVFDTSSLITCTSGTASSATGTIIVN